MLKLRKGKRIVSVMLVVLMLVVSAFTVFAEPASNTPGTSAVGNPLIVEDMVLSQEKVNTIRLTGKLDTSFIEDPTFAVGDIVVRVGEGEFGSQVMNLSYEADGTVDFEIEVNHALAIEYGNYVPVIISYSFNDGVDVVKSEIVYYTGVVTYDMTTGILGAPAGTEYLADVEGTTGEFKTLVNEYAPTDAKGFGDETPNMTVSYDGFEFSFPINTTPVADAPVDLKDVPFLKNVRFDSFLIATDANYEYLIMDASNGVDLEYQAKLFGDDDWFVGPAEGEYKHTHCRPEGIYTVWVRVSADAENGVLASAPVCLGRVALPTIESADALNAFLNKYDQVTKDDDNALFVEVGVDVNASPADTAELIRLYNRLDSNTKLLTEVVEKAEFLLISDYLANHQIALYDTIDELVAEYDYDEIDAMINDAYAAFLALEEERELFAQFDDQLLAKKKAFAMVKINDLTEGCEVDIAEIIGQAFGDEAVELYYNAYLNNIDAATDCVTVDEIFAEFDWIVITTKHTLLENKLNAKYEQYTSFDSNLDEILYEMFFDTIDAILAMDKTEVYTLGNELVDETIVGMLRACAMIEYYGIPYLPEVDIDALIALDELVNQRIAQATTEYEIGMIILEARLQLERLNVEAGIPYGADLDAIDRAIDRVFDPYLDKLAKITTLDEIIAFFGTSATEDMIYARDTYEYQNFIEDYADLLNMSESAVTKADLETIYDVLAAIRAVKVYDVDCIAALSAYEAKFQDLIAAAYTNSFVAEVTKTGDNAARTAEIAKYAAIVKDAANFEKAYNYGLASLAVYDKKVETLAALNALKISGDAVNNAIVDAYINRVNTKAPVVTLDQSDPFVTKDRAIAYFTRELTIAKAEVSFKVTKAEYIGKVSALKDENPVVIAIVDKYLADLNKVTFNYNNVGDDSAAYLTVAVKALSDIEAKATKDSGFEKARAAYLVTLDTEYAKVKENAAKYSEDQLKQIDAIYAAAKVSINNLYIENGNTVDQFEPIVIAAVANFAKVEVSIITVGTPATDYPANYNYDNGLWATVTNYNGMSSALNITIAKVSIEGKELAEKFDVEGIMTNEQATVAVEGKEIAYAFNLKFNDAALLKADNGFYTVRMLLPTELRGVSGLHVLAEGAGKNYVFEATIDGNYVLFKTNQLNATHYIVKDAEVSLLWLVIVLAVVIAAELVIMIFFIIKMKGKKKGDKKVAAFAAPLLAILYSPAGAIPMTIALGAVSILGAIAATTTVVAATKKKTELTDDDISETAVQDAVASEPIAEQPAVQEPVLEETIIEDVEIEEPVVEEVVVDEQVVEEVAVEEPVVQEPVESEPVIDVKNLIIVDDSKDEVYEEADEVEQLVVVNDDNNNATAEDTVKIATPDVADNDTVVVPIVISDDDSYDYASEQAAPVIDDTDDDEGEDKKVFSAENGKRVYVTYDYSFQSKLVQSSADVQSRYAIISDTLLSYGLSLRESWKKERYYTKGRTYANIIFRGKTMCVCLAIAPESLEGTKYFFENVGNIKKFESVPVMIRVRSGRGCKYTLELIKMMMEAAGIDQKRPVSDHFTVRPALTREDLIEKGYIKVMMTDGEGHPIPADFEAMKNNKFFSQSAGMPILKRVSAEEAAALPDEEITGFIETEDDSDEQTTGRRKGIINIDSISEAYTDGEVVTLKSLIEKKLVAKNVDIIKVLARGVLDKALTVKAHDFSLDAAKMIVVAGGSVVKLKKK